MPIASRGAVPADDDTDSRQNTSRCGDSPPSVPPDMTIATRASTSFGAQPSLSASSSFRASVA